ncbi:ribonuclease H-like domain-containing protein, partial [Tanacetum coccineum]
MVNLELCDKHNMVAYLKKPTGSEGFQEILDFLNGSHIRFALIKNPTIYVSLIKKFWQTAIVRTVDNGEQEITAIVDGKEFTITEVSVRRHLQLADVEDEAVYVEGDDRVKRATTNAASLYAARASGGSPGCQEAMGGSITQTRSERVPTSPYDLPLSRVNTLGSYEGSMTLLELTVLCTTLSKKVESLEADLKQTKKMWVAEADFNNLETTMNVSPIPTTRIHKDHTNWIEAMQDELLQFRLKKVERLVDLPKRKMHWEQLDHNLWDVIVNGDLEEESAPTGETFALPASETAKHLACRRNQGRNQEVKKNVLKHQFENFSTASNENLDKAYDRFQKLISQLEVHGAPISKEDINQKFLRSLPPSWNQIALIMRNKPDIDEIDIDDLYNNLRVYEDELKRSLGSNSASQNLDFLSSENASSTNKVSTASGDFGVSTAGGINQVPSTPCAHDVAYSFFAQPTTSPQLENEDFQQMDGDDLEELDLRWQVAMLTVRVKKFIQRTGRNLDFKEKRHVSLDKTKIECYNCHRKGHFARECRSGRNQGRRSYGDNGRSNAPTNESSSQALVAQDGLGGYDWSNDFEVEPVCIGLNVSTARPACTARPKVSTAKLVYAARPVSTARPGNPEILLQDHAVVDSGCSSHITGNKVYLSDYEEFNGGFMAFGSDLKGDELKFNLFSVSQMCDKKNSVLFTESECLILSPSFKLLDESQVVLRAPRKDDVYNLDLKNIVLSGGLEKQLNHNVKIIRCDNGTEFKNHAMNEFYAKKGIKMEFSVARTPQQNGVAERKNRTLIEAARTIFDRKSDEGYLLGYSTSSKDFRVYNKRTKMVEENLHINFLEDQPNVTGTGPNWMFDLDFLTNSMNYILVSVENQVNMDAGTQDSYVAGSLGKDKGPAQEYILLPLQPHRTRIPVEDVPPVAHEKPSESSPKDNDVQDLEDTANKESEQDLQAFEKEKRRIASQKKAAQATSTNKLSTDR